MKSLAISILLLVSMAAPAAAQGWDVFVMPKFGFFASDKPLGTATSSGTLLRLAPGQVAGLAVEVGPKQGWWSARVEMATTLNPGIERASSYNRESCGSGCANVETDYEPVGTTAQVLVMSLQGIISPAPADWKVSPYVLGGVGIKRFDLPDIRYGAPDGYWYGGRDAGLSLQAGLGLRYDVWSGSLHLEAIDYVSGFDGENAPTRTVVSQIFRTIRHDFAVSLGVRLPLL